MPKTPAQELAFPLTAHFRVIAEKEHLEKDRLELAVQPFTLVEALAAANVSAKGRYVSFAFSALVASHEELREIDSRLR